MCVIVTKTPDTEIPYDMLTAACEHNSDGWGISIADRGKLEYRHEYVVGGNEPDRVAEVLEKYKELPLLLHLRHCTVGEKSTANCHPFPVFNKKEHGMDLTFAHNGTLSEFNVKGSSLCDSFHFKETIVKPLLTRCALATENVLDDTLLKTILSHYAGYNSIFTLMNGDGSFLTINKSRGTEYPFGWASNSYSFTSFRSNQYVGRNSNADYSGRFTKLTKKEHNTTLLLPGPKAVSYSLIDKECRTGADIFRKRLDSADKTKPTFVPGFEHRESFCHLMGLHTLDDLQYFSTDDLIEMAKKFPRLAALAILDFLCERLDLYGETE